MANLKAAVVIVVAIVVIFGLVVGLAGMKTVDAGFRGVKKTNWGQVDTSVSLGEGLHIVNPFSGDDVVPMEIRTQKVTALANSGTNDLQSVSAEVAVNIKLNPDRIQYIYKEVGLDYQGRIVTPAIQEAVKQVTAKFKAEQLITQRESVKSQIEESLRSNLAERGIVVEEVFITEFNFSEEFDKAIEAKVKAEQDALKAKNDLERIKFEAQQAEAKAIGEKQAAIAKAEGEAQKILIEAQSQAEAIRLINEQLEKSPEYIEYVKAQRWDGKLPIFVGGGEIPFIFNMSELEARAN